MLLSASGSIADNKSLTMIRFCCLWSEKCSTDEAAQLEKVGNQSGVDRFTKDVKVLSGNPCYNPIHLLLRHKNDWGFEPVSKTLLLDSMRYKNVENSEWINLEDEFIE